MYHQMHRIGERNVLAEIDYRLNEHEQIEITKITAWIGPDEEIDREIPVGLLDMEQVERIESLLYDGHGAVMRSLVDDARIDAHEERMAEMEACI